MSIQIPAHIVILGIVMVRPRFLGGEGLGGEWGGEGGGGVNKFLNFFNIYIFLTVLFN